MRREEKRSRIGKIEGRETFSTEFRKFEFEAVEEREREREREREKKKNVVLQEKKRR